MYHRMTRNSAVVVLAEWISTHGRAPKTLECCASNGLVHYTTYRKLYGTYYAAISAAHELLSAGSAAFERVIGRQTWTCLGCNTPIRREAAHVRHCRECRKRLFATDDDDVHGSLPHSLYRQYWPHPLEDLVAW